MSKGIIILGASGSGKTALGRELARQLNCQHFDCDDYLLRWDTEIPFTQYNTKENRIKRMTNDLSRCTHFVLSGQMWSIRKAFESWFDLGVLLTVPTEIRVERIYRRELERWGDRVRPGGDMYENSQSHLFLAREYDMGEPPVVCIKRDEQWITELPCLVLCADGTKAIAENAMWIAEQYIALQSAT
jgi:adenylate kinase family enzyme